MSVAEQPTTLLGRRAECERLDQLVRRVGAGESQTLLLRGVAGVGKTALLRYLEDQATGWRVALVVGVESEMELAYSGLHQLCAPFLDLVDRLPVPQRRALQLLFGAREGDVPDRFLIGLAVLGLLAEAAGAQALLCIVDDVHWLDEASVHALAFVARRLAADPIGVVFALRDGSGSTPSTAAGTLDGFATLQLQGLTGPDARALLEAAVSGPVDPLVRDRIVAETRGNPLALLELPRSLTATELAYGVDLEDPGALVGRIEQGFVARVRELPASSRELLLLAAADPTGDVSLFWRAAGTIGITAGAAPDAQHSGLIDLAAQVRFRHPLVRSAVYRDAAPAERHRVHRALAEATDPAIDPDRRAWHRAQAEAGVDESVATELEASAGRAVARGGLAAAATFLRRAAELTPDPLRRALRALAAADAKLRGGDADGALALLALAEAGALDELDRARAHLVRAQVAFTVTRGRDAPALLLAAAQRLEPLDATLARETYLDAFSAALFAGRLADSGSVTDIAAAVLAARWGPATRPLPEACDLLLTGLALLLTKGYPAGAPVLQQAVTAFRDLPGEADSLRWLWLACRIARQLGDDGGWDELTDRQVQLARRVGALAVLPIALTERFSVELFTGHHTEALALAAEAEAVVSATGTDLAPHIAFLHAAWRGDETTTEALLDANRAEVAERGEGLWLVGTDWTSAVFLNSLGRYDEALVAAERAAEFQHDLGHSSCVLPELVEAAVRTGRSERAVAALAQLSEVATACDTDWMCGLALRSRALLAEGVEAERLYREAITRLERTRILVPRARAHLLYGEWLRRERRRADAREQLTIAHEIFLDLGMAAFAERARRELVATGATARSRSVDTFDDLTAQEEQIVRLAVAGQTNPEIGAQLFLSPRTVEWHLRKVFGKLGVSSRKELVHAVAKAGAR